MRECASSKHTGNVIRGGTSSEVGRGVWYSVVDFNLCSGIAPDLTAGLEHSTYASLWRQGKVSPRYTQALSVSSSMLGVCAVEECYVIAHGMISDGGVLGNGPLKTVCMEEKGHCYARR